jgi:raffinose/stachyose/melibiose transport system permease protein
MQVKKNTRKLRPKTAVFGTTYWSYVYILPVFVFIGIFTYFATFYNVNISFHEWNGVSKNKLFVGFGNFVNMFSDPYFFISLKNTFIYFLITVPVQALVGFFIATIYQRDLYLKGLTRSIIFLPNVIALVVIGYVFNQMFNYQYGFINDLLKSAGLGKFAHDWTGDPATALYAVIVTNIYVYVGFSMTLYITGILGVSPDILEAATIDGASGWNVTWHITLPLLRPTHVTILILGIVGTLKTFDILWLITMGGPARQSEMLGTMLYRAYILEYKAGYAAAISIVVMIIALILASINIYLQSKSND